MPNFWDTLGGIGKEVGTDALNTAGRRLGELAGSNVGTAEQNSEYVRAATSGFTQGLTSQYVETKLANSPLLYTILGIVSIGLIFIIYKYARK